MGLAKFRFKVGEKVLLDPILFGMEIGLGDWSISKFYIIADNSIMNEEPYYKVEGNKLVELWIEEKYLYLYKEKPKTLWD